MEFKTTVNVSGQNLYDEIGVLKMLAFAPKEDGSLAVSAEYRKEDGTPVKSISETYEPEEVEALYQAVKDGLTPDLNGVLSVWEQVGQAMIVKMAATFKISTSEIVKNS